MGPVMLALSTFRQSERAVRLALERARGNGRLLVVDVVDVNLARYFMGTDVGFYPGIMKAIEDELLARHEADARRRVASVEDRARAEGIEVESRVEVGRFALVCLPIAREVLPEVVFTTRSARPAWVRRLFGSPVDDLIAGAGCPVVEV